MANVAYTKPEEEKEEPLIDLRDMMGKLVLDGSGQPCIVARTRPNTYCLICLNSGNRLRDPTTSAKVLWGSVSKLLIPGEVVTLTQPNSANP